VEQAQPPQIARSDAGPGLADHGVEPVGEGDGHHPPRLGRGGVDPPGAGAIERHRLFQHDVLARRQSLQGQGLVQVVGGADVDDVDAVGLDQLLAGREGVLGAHLLGRDPPLVRRGSRHADQAGTGQPGGPGVHPADEPRADDGRTQRHHGRQPTTAFERMTSISLELLLASSPL
jgi:hypothetical protein